MFNIYKVEKELKQKEAIIQNQQHENDPSVLQKKQAQKEAMSIKYRQRVAGFVTKMASSPVTKQDEYTKTWHNKFGNQTSRSKIEVQQELSSPMSTRTKGNLLLPSLRATNGVKLEPVPFRFTNKDTKERVDAAVTKNSNLETIPQDVDKKAFNLRLRQPKKELAHSKFRLKSFSTVDRLNTMYEDDLKILDVEMLGVNAGTFNNGIDARGINFQTKRRLSMPQATIKYHKLKESQSKKLGSQIFRPEFLEQEKKKILARLAKSKSQNSEQEISTEQIYQMIKKKHEKKQGNTENPDLGNRNFMIPSYHTKTHFKGATGLHLQAGTTSLIASEQDLRVDFKLSHRIDKATDPFNQKDDTLDPNDFTKIVLQNCGEIRQKNKSVLPTERGTGFLRKISVLQGANDPAKTFFGLQSSTAEQLYGGTSRDHLQAAYLKSQRNIALNSQIGRNSSNGHFKTQTTRMLGQTYLSRGGANQWANPFAGSLVSLQSGDFKARMNARREQGQNSGSGIHVGAATDLMNRFNKFELDNTNEYSQEEEQFTKFQKPPRRLNQESGQRMNIPYHKDHEYNQEIADDDSFFAGDFQKATKKSGKLPAFQ